MRAHARRKHDDEDLRRRILRLNAIPARPATARGTLSGISEESGDFEVRFGEPAKIRSLCENDPGWMLAQACSGSFGSVETLEWIWTTPWWSAADLSAEARECLTRLWRYSAAISLAARWFARDAGDPDPGAVASAGFLSQLGCWVVAAVQPEWLVRWCREADPIARREREVAELGMDLNELGRHSAERWGCAPLVVDATWLNGQHADTLVHIADEPRRLTFINEAMRWAERTPWALGRSRPCEPAPNDNRSRILVAETQVRCSASFVADDATPLEERFCRQSAGLRVRLLESERKSERLGRLAEALAESDPRETPDEWADRAARSWCAEAGVNAARVAWVNPEASDAARPRAQQPGPRAGDDGQPNVTGDTRPAALIIPLAANHRMRAEIQIWNQLEESDRQPTVDSTLVEAWNTWAALVADRSLLEKRLIAAIASIRLTIESEETRLRERKLDALGEFAGGAGHELNNPLAVIVGRAQLILSRTSDPETRRSLRITLEQAARAHSMLRDLMFIARPPEPRPRGCGVAELLESCLREHHAECMERGIRLLDEIDRSLPDTWADPEALRHLADLLLKNAIQATPAGGSITVRAARLDDELLWSFVDSGKGMNHEEADHLFDPFFCGRQAGRGLGLGLARAARIVEQARGRLRWSSSPAHGSTFHVHLPIGQPPAEARAEQPART